MRKTFRYRFYGFHDYDVNNYTNLNPFTVVQQHNPYDIDIEFEADPPGFFFVDYAMNFVFKFKRLGELVDGVVVPVPDPPEP